MLYSALLNPQPRIPLQSYLQVAADVHTDIPRIRILVSLDCLFWIIRTHTLYCCVESSVFVLLYG
jgi:hypothetical protein